MNSFPKYHVAAALAIGILVGLAFAHRPSVPAQPQAVAGERIDSRAVAVWCPPEEAQRDSEQDGSGQQLGGRSVSSAGHGKKEAQSSNDSVDAFLSESGIEWATAVQRLRADGKERARLIERFSQEKDTDVRSRLRRLLKTIDAPEVGALALQFADSGDPARRAEGLDLLAGAAGASVGGKAHLLQALRLEQDPSVVLGAIGSMQLGSMTPAEAGEIAGRLRSLLKSDDASVRAQSINALVHWDRRSVPEGDLYAALVDPAPEVRASAMEAMAASNVASERIKDRLLEILKSSPENDPNGGLARMVLRQFHLNDSERALVGEPVPPVIGAGKAP